MYSNVHGTIGTVIVLATYAITKDEFVACTIGSTLAFLAHDPTDLLGEKSYGDLKTSLIYEGVPLLLFAVMACFSNLWYMYAIGWIAGNMMDIWDKKLYLSMVFPKRFKSSTDFRCHRRRPKINFTLTQTKVTTYICSLIIILITVLNK